MSAATAESLVRHRAVYENWRPPVVGVALLVPVGPDCLAVADLLGTLMLPAGGVYDGQTLEEAAHRVLSGPTGGLQLLRRVAVDRVQARRREIITHVLATAPTTADVVEELVYRDPRATIRVMPTPRVIDRVWPRARPRILVGLQALAIGETACIDGHGVQDAHDRQPRDTPIGVCALSHRPAPSPPATVRGFDDHPDPKES
ncbi:hypothetical protein [Streptomyces sp. NPDC048665]|uniref:hypothetical protein n=1 Tax=Streptomyces sp. NPDC048665 TaxID=3155490 RepID=UPI00344960EF